MLFLKGIINHCSNITFYTSAINYKKHCKYTKHLLAAGNFFFACNVHQTLTLSQTTNFRLFQTERLSRRQFQIRYKWQKVLKTGRKHCGKRRNCSLRAIFPFPAVFPKHEYCRHIKIWACLGKGSAFLPFITPTYFSVVLSQLPALT